jgi:hypothetical protein
MSIEKNTPGPWYESDTVVVTKDNGILAELPMYAEYRENCLLMAAAPELRQALAKVILRNNDSYCLTISMGGENCTRIIEPNPKDETIQLLAKSLGVEPGDVTLEVLQELAK